LLVDMVDVCCWWMDVAFFSPLVIQIGAILCSNFFLF
jgi:hypothetical protein